MRYCSVVLLTIILGVVGSPTAFGYEGDVLYRLTEFLAQWVAFSEANAEQIVAADQELDAKPQFNPLPNLNFCPELSQLPALPTPAVIQATAKDDVECQRMLMAQRQAETQPKSRRPQQGDVEKKEAAYRNLMDFLRKYAVQEWVSDPICRDPFAYEGKTMAAQVYLEEMTADDTATLVSGACKIMVSGIPQGTFAGWKWNQGAILIAKVLGRSEEFPHLQFVGILVCKEEDCAELR